MRVSTLQRASLQLRNSVLQLRVAAACCSCVLQLRVAALEKELSQLDNSAITRWPTHSLHVSYAQACT
jgi:hypothetical protein